MAFFAAPDGKIEWKNVAIFSLFVLFIVLLIGFAIYLAVLIFVTNDPAKILKKGCPEGSEIKNGKCNAPVVPCTPTVECTTNAECSDGKSCLTGSVCGECTAASDCIDPVQRSVCTDGVCTA